MCNEVVLAGGRATMLLHEKLFEMVSAEIPQTLLSRYGFTLHGPKIWGRRKKRLRTKISDLGMDTAFGKNNRKMLNFGGWLKVSSS